MLDLFEIDLDGPPCLIDPGDRTGGPVEVVGQEDKALRLAVNHDAREDAKLRPGWLLSFHTADSSPNRRNQPPVLSDLRIRPMGSL